MIPSESVSAFLTCYFRSLALLPMIRDHGTDNSGGSDDKKLHFQNATVESQRGVHPIRLLILAHWRH